MKKKNFTLIELIVVIIVLGLLAAIVIPNISNMKKEATIAALEADAKNIEIAVDLYELKKNGASPTKDGTTFNKDSAEIEEITLLDGTTTFGELILLEELVENDFLRKYPKNKEASFYLLEGGSVSWVHPKIKDKVDDEDNIPESTFDPKDIVLSHFVDTNEWSSTISYSLSQEGINNPVKLILPNGSETKNLTGSIKVVKDGKYTVKAIYKNGTEKDFDIDIDLGNPFTYTVDETSATVTGYNGTATDIIIPSQIEGKPVTTIGSYALIPTSLSATMGKSSVTATSVVIPNSVKTISSYAFYGNKLTTISIPDSITSVGSSAFANNQLTSISLSKSLTSIEASTFSNNQLTNVIIPNSVTSIKSSAFYINKLTSVIIPNSVTSIGVSAFDKNELTSVTIPESITYLDHFSFRDNKLTNITIPNSVTSIGSGVFESNPLTTVTLSNNLISIGAQAFRYTKLTSVTIPNSVTSIGYQAFIDNQLTSVTLSNNLTSIEDEAFKFNKLTSITIPNSMKTIGKNAFFNNPLTSVLDYSGLINESNKASYFQSNPRLEHPTN